VIATGSYRSFPPREQGTGTVLQGLESFNTRRAKSEVETDDRELALWEEVHVARFWIRSHAEHDALVRQ